MLRGRKAPPPASPYLRPVANGEEPRHPPDGQSGSATWISGIFAGAGRILSSVFRSDSPSSSCSYSYSTDWDSSINSDEGEDMDVSSKECDEPKQIERKLEPVKDCNGTSLAIISEIESKHAIEQLIMQETFSRDEGNKLIKIIESRVVEAGKDGIHKEPDRTMCSAFASPGTWKSLDLSRKLPEAISHSSGSRNAISTGSSAFQMLTPELCNSAVMEAKKWLEDKKLVSSSRVDFDCRPCNLNTNMLQYDFGGEEGSPVYVAKSYMRSLSPCKSPLSNIGFEKTPCTRMYLYKDEAPFATPNYFVSSSMGLKRNHSAFGSQDTVDEIRRVRLKSTDDVSDNSKFKLIDSSERYSKDEACETLSAAEKLIHHNSSMLPASESLDGSADYSEECCVKYYCSVGKLGVHGERTDEVKNPVIRGNTISANLISDTEEAVNEVQSTHGTSSLTTWPSDAVNAVPSTHETSSLATLPSRPNPSVGTGSHFCGSVDVEQPWQVKERLDSLSGPCTTLAPVPASGEHADDHSETLLNSEAQNLQPVDIYSTPSDIEAVPRQDGVTTSRIQLCCGSENNSLQQTLTSGVNKKHSVPDPVHQDSIGQIQDEAMQQDGNGQIQEETNELKLKISANGPSEGLSTSLDVALTEEPNATNFSNVGPAPGISERTYDTDIPVPKITNTVTARSRSRGGTKMKAVKDVLTEPQPSTNRGRGRKSVPGARRGRGR